MTKAAPIGILMLDTRFPRVPGDPGNPESWPVPVRIRRVLGATPQRIVREDPLAMLAPFVEAAEALVAEGCGTVTTTCGFLTLFQKALTEALPVPVVTSALCLLPRVEKELPAGRRAGILTIAASRLSPAHLSAVGVPRDTPIGTTEGGAHFTETILGNAENLDTGLARADCVAAAQAMQARHPGVGALVLECTNMAPYAAAIAQTTGLPVFSLIDAVQSDGAQMP